MAASACLTLALLHLFVWVRQPKQLAYLYFSIMAMSIAVVAIWEMRMIHATSPAEYGMLLRQLHVPLASLFIGLIGFVHVYIGHDRLWLGVLAGALRISSMVVNFLLPVNLNFTEIKSLGHMRFLGDALLAYPVGTASPWAIMGQASSLLLLLYVLDASVRAYKGGNRRHSVLVGGSICAFVVVAASHSALMNTGIIHSPTIVAWPFAGAALIMGFELSSGVLRAAILGEDLRVSRNELHLSKQRLDLAAAAGKLGLWTLNLENNSVWMNESCRTILGPFVAEPDNFEALLQSVHVKDQAVMRAAVETAVRENAPYQCEFRTLAGNLPERWIFSRGCVEFKGGQPHFMHGACADITERRMAEERFRSVFERAPNALVIANASDAIVMANAEAERVFQYSKDQLHGEPLAMLLPERDRFHLPASPDTPPTAIEGDSGSDRETYGRRRDGSTVALEIVLQPIDTTSGPLMLASLVDVTERKQAELTAAKQRNELMHLSRVTMLGEISGSLAHELNQPLTAILTNAETARRLMTQSPPDIAELDTILGDIVDDVSRAAEIIRNLRALQKKTMAEFAELDLPSLLRSAARLIGAEVTLRNASIAINCEADLPSVRGDKVQLQQVLVNLLLNALDAMKAQSGDRIVTMEAHRDGPGTVRVTVRDTGSGLSDDTIGKMFEPFYTSKPDGLGLGLSICRSIIEAHSGRLHAENNSVTGAALTFTLMPFHEVAQSEIRRVS